MLKRWTKLFGFGIAYCFFFIGLIFGAVGKCYPAYSVGLGEVIVVIFMTIVPFVIGIHVGVWNQQEENKPNLKHVGELDDGRKIYTESFDPPQ